MTVSDLLTGDGPSWEYTPDPDRQRDDYRNVQVKEEERLLVWFR